MKRRICQVGIFNPEYIRNKVIASGFEENGYEVTQLTVDPSVGVLKKYKELARQYRALKNKTFDFVIVAWPGWTIVAFACWLFKRRVVYDAFMSAYNSNVEDRKKYPKWHPFALRDWLYDWHACLLAKKVLLPEKVHVAYFMKTFGFPRSKFIQIYTGANDHLFKPQPEIDKAEEFTVHFHGNFIPLQGIEYIIDAANSLKDERVQFQIVGGGAGDLFESIKQKVQDLGLTNVALVGRQPLEDMQKYIARVHVCLGVFGNTEKTQFVISNKIYECIAMGKPVITSRTPATEELFTNQENILFVEPQNGSDLAEKIRVLKEDPALRNRIGKGGYELFKTSLTPKILVSKLLVDLVG